MTQGKKRIIKIGDEEYEEVPQLASAASTIISDMYLKLGKPKDPFSRSGEKLMDIIISVWHDLYPQDAREWFAMRSEYQNAEMSITEQVHQRTGRSLASYPYPIYQIMKRVFPEFDSAKRENCMKMVQKWPMFRFANKV